MPKIHVDTFWFPEEGSEIVVPFYTRTKQKGTILYDESRKELIKLPYKSQPERRDVAQAISKYTKYTEPLRVVGWLDFKVKSGQLRQAGSPNDFDYFADKSVLDEINKTLTAVYKAILQRIDDPLNQASDDKTIEERTQSITTTTLSRIRRLGEGQSEGEAASSPDVQDVIAEFERLGNKVKDTRYKDHLEDLVRSYKSAVKEYQESHEGPLPDKIKSVGKKIKDKKFSLETELRKPLGSMGIDW